MSKATNIQMQISNLSHQLTKTDMTEDEIADLEEKIDELEDELEELYSDEHSTHGDWK